MEKLIYPLWKSPSQASADFNRELLETLAPALLSLPLAGLQICLIDDDVAPAQQYFIASMPPAPEAVISIWLDSYLHREAVEQQLAPHCEKFAAYLVTESEPLRQRDVEAPLGQRTTGMNQVVFLQKPAHLARADWLDIWHNSHTQIAIDTQSTFRYRQNVVTQQLDSDAPVFDAIVEENFPNAAMHNREAFYNAEGNPELCAQRLNTMIESCSRFIDFNQINCIPMSEYVYKRF